MSETKENVYLWQKALVERAKDLSQLTEELKKYTTEDIGYIVNKFKMLKEQIIKDSKIDPDAGRL